MTTYIDEEQGTVTRGLGEVTRDLLATKPPETGEYPPCYAKASQKPAARALFQTAVEAIAAGTENRDEGVIEIAGKKIPRSSSGEPPSGGPAVCRFGLS